MSGLSKLGQCVGGWRGVNRFQDSHTGAPDDSAGAVVVTTLLAGRFVRMDYTWAYQDTGPGGVAVDWPSVRPGAGHGALDRFLAHVGWSHAVRGES